MERDDGGVAARVGADGPVARVDQRRGPRQGDVAHRPEKVDVAADAVVFHPGELLERGVVERPQILPLVGLRIAEGLVGGVGVDPCQAEVDELHLAERRDEDVGGLDVAVRHAAAMGVFEPRAHLVEEIDRPAGIEGPADLHQLAEGLPLDELHGDVDRVVLLADILDGADVGMAHEPSHLPLAPEPAALLGILGVAAAEHLDGELGAVVDIHGPVDPRERAGADLVEDLGRAEEVATLFAAEEAVTLVAGEHLAPQEQVGQILDGNVVPAELRPRGVEIALADELQFLREVGEFLGGGGLHRQAAPMAQVYPLEARQVGRATGLGAGAGTDWWDWASWPGVGPSLPPGGAGGFGGLAGLEPRTAHLLQAPVAPRGPRRADPSP